MLKITLIACGNKMPAWIATGAAEYAKRLKEFVNLSILEIPLIKRTKSSDSSRLLEKESELICVAIPNRAHVIALEIEGESFSSEKLAAKIELLQGHHSHLCFLIGGPEGLHAQTLARSAERWSLSKLTLPHPLVRIMLLEGIYRAFSIINNHPYHK